MSAPRQTGEGDALPSLSLVSSFSDPEYGAYAPTGVFETSQACFMSNLCSMGEFADTP